MTVATVRAVTERFLKDDQPGVLVLKGAWGVGKTYAWNRLVSDCRDNILRSKYCYVSLFGVSSIADLKTVIFTKTQAVQRLGKRVDAATLNKEWFGLLIDQMRGIYAQGSRLIGGLPYGKNITVGIETLAPHLIRDMVICFDDLERFSADRGKTEELLGFITELKEEKNCKVILVFNEEKLNCRDVYERYREKVVDIELLYDPTPEEAVAIALPADLPHRAAVTRHCIALGVKNIRLLRKVVNIIVLVTDTISPVHPQILEQAAQTVVLLAWCYFESDSKKPSIEFLRDWNNFAWGFKEARNEASDIEKAWITILNAYGLSHLDDFDWALFKVLERGYIEETGLVEAAKALNTECLANELRQSFSDAWDAFHNTFSNNTEELVESLVSSFKRSVQHVSPINLDGLTTLLRQLGRGSLADELIEYYFDPRNIDVRISNLEDGSFSTDIKDGLIRDRLSRRKVRVTSSITLVESVQNLLEGFGRSGTYTEALKRATEDDFYALFKQEHGRDLSRIVSCCLQFEGSKDNHSIFEKARAALVRIGKEDPLNALRVRRYRVNV